MDDKKLNFNRPLLSVRRFSSTVADSTKDSSKKNESEASLPAVLSSPSYKSDLHSGPLRKPGSVPFVWEQSPGRPKDETPLQKHPAVPKLPPGRILKPKKQDLDMITEDFMVSKGARGPRKDSRTQIRDDEDGNVIYRENEKPGFTYGPNFLLFKDDYNDENDEENSESDYDEHENMSYKICGLLPQFWLKGSVGILNPVPGLSVRTRLRISTANGTYVDSSSSTRLAARVPAYENKSLAEPQKDQNVVNSGSTEATNQKNPQKPEGSGPYDRLQGRVVSSNRTKSASPKKGLVSFKELLANDTEKAIDFQTPAVEKTLYVDTIHEVKTAKSDFTENDLGIFGISHISADSFKSDVQDVDKLKDKEIITQKGIFKLKDPKADQKVKISQQKNRLELPALPKSPSDSWLWRTLPSLSSKPASLRSKPNCNSKTKAKLDKNFQARYPQGLMLPIPET